MQAILAPSARYMVAETAGGRQSWKAVSLEEYKSITKRSPHFLPSFGVVQLMAQVASLHMAANVGTMSEVNHDMHLRLNPQVLQNSTSSCIYASYDVATPLLSIENIVDGLTATIKNPRPWGAPILCYPHPLRDR